MSVNSDSGSLTLLGGGGVSLIGAHFNISSGQDLELFTALSVKTSHTHTHTHSHTNTHTHTHTNTHTHTHTNMPVYSGK